MLLLATGTGLAPLFGVVREALSRGHVGNIHLYHGSRHPEGVYLRSELLALQARYPNLRYYGCVSGARVPDEYLPGRVHDVALSRHRDLAGWRVYLAGSPAMVLAAAEMAAARGAHRSEIFADPFELRDLRSAPRPAVAPATDMTVAAADVGPSIPPDLALWEALGRGDLLQTILQDFYARVYEDSRLAGFFHGVTRQRAVEKQFLFMRQIIAGEKVYFGDRPRNAHHWMVISDELFDYREELLMDCLRRHGLAEELVQRWRAIDERFRGDLVKSAPWKRVVGGVELPLDGFDETILDVGSLCDGCGEPIESGERVRYHVRLGKVYCARCHAGAPTAGKGHLSIRDDA
jgi:truncated hemoglobin YjbI